MSIHTTTTCDFCGKIKGESNNWYALSVFSQQLRVQHPCEGTNGWKDACGESCVLKAVQRFLATGKVTE